MQKVDIYIQTTARGPAIRKHVAYMYVLKIVINGKEFIRNGKDTLENVTENQATLQAIIHALMRFRKNCEIRINTECVKQLQKCMAATVGKRWLDKKDRKAGKERGFVAAVPKCKSWTYYKLVG